METLLSEKEAALFLGLSEERLKRLVEDEIVPAYLIAGQFLRFKKEELATLKYMLGAEQDAGEERVFNKAFLRVRGIERLKEILRANDVYLIVGIAIFTILIFMFFR